MQPTETKHAHKCKAKKDKGSTNEILGLGSRFHHFFISFLFLPRT